MRYQDIFVPGGFPRHTYNPRTELQLEQQLSESKNNLCKLVTVTGQTKSGKTVLAKKIYPPEDSIWIDGGTVATEDDFWQVIIQQLELFQQTQEENATESGTGTSTTTGGEGNIVVAKASLKISASDTSSETSAKVTSQTLSSRITALAGLREHHRAIIIDDFHYLPKDMQASIVRALKPLIFEGIAVIIIAISSP